MSIIEELKNNNKAIFMAFLCSFCFAMPFAIHNLYFVDDWLRAEVGSTGWELNGRPLSSIIMTLFSLNPMGFQFFGNGLIADIFPSSLVLMCAVSTVTGVLIYKSLDVKSSWCKFLIIVCITINPYWLGNLAFRFDSLIMSISLLFGCIATICVYEKWRGNIITAFACLLLMFCTYQASLNAALALMTVLCFAELKKSSSYKNVVMYAIKFALLILISYVIYSKLILSQLTLSPYTIKSGEMLPFDKHFISNLIDNTSLLAKTFFSPNSGLMLIALLAMLAYSSLSLLRRDKRTASKVDIVAFVLAPIVIILASFLSLSILKHPPVSVRVFLGSSMVLVYFFYLCDQNKSKIFIAIGSLYIIFAFTLSSVVSNVITSVQTNDRFMAQYISTKLYENGYKDGNTVYLEGRPRPVPSVQNAIEMHPFLREFTYSVFVTHNFKYSLLRQYNITSVTPAPKEAVQNILKCRKMPDLYSDNMIRICKNNNSFSVSFK
ncbi:glucosyltransferase domain-containing protein [Enterobacter hormaechei]|uniref:glucosyltransferase domain-containing protein n=1 Tax=Enterobacter hormaechei TaxID=158836 RepID=UPI0018E6A5CB|nr:glucosyltransferase domain-containing protein [Enterobacter hormaechei]MBI8957287.1 glucosyltransferase domain-containing protein [Enterobacter hormaechei]MBI8991716.1 glucosyltransferase domain-containing protein [Enterobacter hormaechei]HCM9718232.1 glucosyltransferase domain-containing protein [Enterobacter hormaechei subsp. steigerwaltii]